MIEQRKSLRQRTFFGAQLSIDAFAGWSVECTIKDLGQGGARLALPARTTIPNRFKLAIFKRKTDSAARLVWHRDGLVGVTFETDTSDPHDVVSASGPTATTRLERRIAAIVSKSSATLFPFERRARFEKARV